MQTERDRIYAQLSHLSDSLGALSEKAEAMYQSIADTFAQHQKSISALTARMENLEAETGASWLDEPVEGKGFKAVVPPLPAPKTNTQQPPAPAPGPTPPVKPPRRKRYIASPEEWAQVDALYENLATVPGNARTTYGLARVIASALGSKQDHTTVYHHLREKLGAPADGRSCDWLRKSNNTEPKNPQ